MSEFLYSRQFERSWVKSVFGIYLGTGFGFAFVVMLGAKVVGPQIPYFTAMTMGLAALVFLAFARLFRTFTRPSLRSLFLSQPVLEIRDDGVLLRSWSRHLIPWAWIEKAIYPVYVWPVGLGPFRDCLVLKLRRPNRFRDRKHFPLLLLQNLLLFWSPYRYLWVFDTGLGPVFDKFMAINQYRDRRNRNRRAPVLKADLDQGPASVDASLPIPDSAPAADSEGDEPPREFNLPAESSLYQGLANLGGSLFAKVESLSKESDETPPRRFNLSVENLLYHGAYTFVPPLFALVASVAVSSTGKPTADLFAFVLALLAYGYCFFLYAFCAYILRIPGATGPIVECSREGLRLSFYTERPIPWSIIDGVSTWTINFGLWAADHFSVILNIRATELAELGLPIVKRIRRPKQTFLMWPALTGVPTQHFCAAVKYYKEKFTRSP